LGERGKKREGEESVGGGCLFGQGYGKGDYTEVGERGPSREGGLICTGLQREKKGVPSDLGRWIVSPGGEKENGS